MKKPPFAAFSYVIALAIVIATTALGYFLNSRFPAVFPTQDLVLLYLFAVVVTALGWGHQPAIVASVASAVIFDFFFIPPRFVFNPIQQQDWVALASFISVGFLIGTLMNKTRESARRIRDMEFLHEREKFKSILLNSVSHDLRTPLSSITTALSDLFYNPDIEEETRKELIETAYGESVRLNQLVGNLLDMTRVEAGNLNITLKPCDLGDLVGAALGQFSKEQMTGHFVQVHIPESLPEISADFTLMMKVLVNIIDNALKYSSPNSPIEISARATKDGLLLEIRDQGLGIPEKDLTRIFDKFYRVDRPEKIPGSGLGLAICKGIIEAHQGKIWAENNSPRGTKVILTIPLNMAG